MRLLLAAVVMVGIPLGCSAAGTISTPQGTSNTIATASVIASPTQALTPAPTPKPTPTPAPTASSVSTPNGAMKLHGGALEPGTYYGDFDRTRMTFTVSETGWYGYAEHDCCVITRGDDDDEAVIFFGGDITELVANACDWPGTEFQFGPTVDDLAEAMASLQDLKVTGPTDATLSGFRGKRVILTVPLDADFSDCYDGSYWLTPTRYYQRPGQSDDNWILDVNGKRWVPTFSTRPSTPAQIVEEMERIRDSLVIEPL